ncbi:FtsX-like permease family protein [Maricaulis sp.]|uniref:ABC transporter permease n=1 Tax=Maricaulis sp. TaxID=1486257 RepID=UPI0025C015D5|nr:FtsX-like permease family protein [Maricaulis sp.]
MNDLTLIRKNLFRKKLRAILLTLSILIAFFIFTIIGSFNRVLNAGVELAAADRLITMNNSGFTQSLPYAYWGRIQAIEGVRNVSHMSWFGGYYQQPTQVVQTFAVDPETYLAAYPEFLMPDDQRAAFLTQRDCLLVGETLALQYGWSVGDRVPLLSNIWQKTDGSSSWEFDICAIYTASVPEMSTAAAYLNYDYYNEALAFNQDRVGMMVVNTDDPMANDAIANQIDAMFANSTAQTDTATEAAFTQAFINQIGNIGLILVYIIGAAFGIILLIVGTSLVVAISERTREIAVMKTLGFPAPRIFRMVLIESVMLSLVGGLAGVGLATLVLKGLAPVLAAFMPGLVVTPGIFGMALAMMIGFGLITGIGPAMNAHRVRIVDALGKQ